MKITGVRLDNLAVCEYAIKHLHESIGNKTTITAKEFFEVNDKAIVAWVTSLHRCFPEPPPPPPMAPPPEEDVEEEHETVNITTPSSCISPLQPISLYFISNLLLQGGA